MNKSIALQKFGEALFKFKPCFLTDSQIIKQSFVLIKAELDKSPINNEKIKQIIELTNELTTPCQNN